MRQLLIVVFALFTLSSVALAQTEYSKSTGYFRFNSKILHCSHKLKSAERGQWGIIDFRLKGLVYDTAKKLDMKAMLVSLYFDDELQLACVEGVENVIKFKHSYTTREACLVYTGTYTYKGKKIPLLKACPMLTEEEVEQHLEEKDKK